MFRFTIRDFLLVTAVTGVSLAWWLDHQTIAAANAESLSALSQAVAAKEVASEDARMLAHYSVHGCRCGNELMGFVTLQEKYGVRPVFYDQPSPVPPSTNLSP